MTRLTTDCVKSIEQNLKEYDAKLARLIGMDMKALAFYAANKQVLSSSEMKLHKVAVVRISTGKGVIGSFAESVAAVIRYMGAEAFVPEACDVAGIYEAISCGAEILFMADDDRFIAINVKTGIVTENDEAVALGYVTALSAMAEGLSGKEVLQLGFGRLGKKTLARLLFEGAIVNVYDCDSEKTKDHGELIDQAKAKGEVKYFTHLPLPLTGLVMDVTNEGGFLSAKDLTQDVIIVAPGLPLSLDDDAYMHYNDNVMHDPLQTGVAVMLAMVLNA
jgi:pyrrolysine biosynthesis protein PylD